MEYIMRQTGRSDQRSGHGIQTAQGGEVLSDSQTNTKINHGGAVDEQIFEDECKGKPDNVEGGGGSRQGPRIAKKKPP